MQFLRNIPRAVGFPTLLMGTNTFAANLLVVIVGSRDSRGDKLADRQQRCYQCRQTWPPRHFLSYGLEKTASNQTLTVILKIRKSKINSFYFSDGCLRGCFSFGLPLK
jgi:hypothetical protein